MKQYKVESVRRTKSLFRVYEKRKVRGKVEYVCIAIATGSLNAEKLETSLNQSARRRR